MSGGSVDDLQKTSISYFVGDPRTQRHERGVLHVVSGGDTVCVENVPKFVSPAEFLSHIATFRQEILRFRIVGCAANKAQYLIMIRFSSSAAAERLRTQHHGKPLSALGSEVLFIRFVEQGGLEGDGGGKVPLLGAASLTGVDSSEACPVCLEELSTGVELAGDDESPPCTALWITMCGHTAHLACLQAYETSSGCPVCRFNPLDLGMECSVKGCCEVDPLWMCLVCGNLGCGRYQKGHAEQHYFDTAHTYCLDVYNGTVWDYAGDGFVHRLVANSTDGKMVESSGPGSTDLRTSEDQLDVEDAKFESQIDAISDAYSRRLEEQLEAQKRHFDEELLREEAALEAIQVPATPPWEEEAAALRKEAHRLTKQAKKVAVRVSSVLHPELETEQAFLKQITSSIARFKDKTDSLKKAPKAHRAKLEELEGLHKQVDALMKQLE